MAGVVARLLPLDITVLCQWRTLLVISGPVDVFKPLLFDRVQNPMILAVNATTELAGITVKILFILISGADFLFTKC